MKVFRLLFLFTLILTVSKVFAQESTTYTFVTYNVENLFDADGVAVFEDYLPPSESGEGYSPQDILTKITNVVTVLQKVEKGKGPDIVSFVELESDFTPSEETLSRETFLEKYADQTLENMLGEGFNQEIADLPSELLLLKACEDAGLTGYDFSVGKSAFKSDGKPENVQKCVLFSRFPILHDSTKIHPLKRARPALENWVDVQGAPLVIFSNHWKSGASSADMEAIRLGNAQVVRDRIDTLLLHNPHLDIIVSGDLNTNYNQHQTLPEVGKTAIRDILKSTGFERKVSSGEVTSLYNVWYELPRKERGTEVYRGNLSTLMNILLTSGLYDYKGVQYVDNSAKVLKYPGLNQNVATSEPIRWSSFDTGSGFSDHFPLMIQFRVVSENDPSQKLMLSNPSVESTEPWVPVSAPRQLPSEEFVLTLESVDKTKLKTAPYFNRYFKCTLPLDERGYVTINGENYKIYSYDLEAKNKIGEFTKSGKPMTFIGRLFLYKTTWEFIIEDASFILH